MWMDATVMEDGQKDLRPVNAIRDMGRGLNNRLAGQVASVLGNEIFAYLQAYTV